MFTALIAQATEMATGATQKVLESDVLQNKVVAAASASLWTHILRADPLVKLTLLVLIFFSVMCWAVIFFKFIQIKSAQKMARRFWQKFSATLDMNEVANTRGIRRGPLFEIFSAGHQTLGKIKKTTNKMGDF